MNRKFLIKTAVTSALLSLCTICTVWAEYITDAVYNYDTDRVEVSGKFFEDYNGEYARILVLKEGGNPTAVTASMVEKQDELMIANNGFDYAFELNKTSTDGKYTVIVKAGKTEKSTVVTYESDIEGTLETLFASEDAFVSGLKDNAELGLDSGIFGSLSEEGQEAVAKAVYEVIENDWTAEELKDKIDEIAILEAIKEDKREVILDGYKFISPGLLGLDTLDSDLGVTAYALYCESITTQGQDKVIDKLMGNEYADTDEFLTDFVYNTTIAAIKYNKKSGTSSIKGILNDNNSVNKFDLTNYKSVSDNSIDLELLNGKEWDKDDIQGILDTESDGGSGGGGSSGSKLDVGAASGNYSANYGVGADTVTEETGTFTDLADVEWAKDSIEGLAEAGVVAGRGNGIYAPLDKVTRAEFLQMLVKALSVTATDATCDFPDVIAGEWYYDAVATGTTLGLASGYGNGYFGTTDLITRQDAAVMLNNAAVKSGKELISINDGIDFADKADISDYAADDVDVLVKAGILSGSDGNFMPKANTTRAEAAVMIWKLMSVLGLEG